MLIVFVCLRALQSSATKVISTNYWAPECRASPSDMERLFTWPGSNSSNNNNKAEST